MAGEWNEEGPRPIGRGPKSGGYEIRTREAVTPTRFPSVRHRPLGESSTLRARDMLSHTTPREYHGVGRSFSCALRRIRDSNPIGVPGEIGESGGLDG